MFDATALPAQPVRRGYGIRKLYNFLRNRLHLSRTLAERVSQGLIRLRHPLEVRRRRRWAQAFDTAGTLALSRERGWAALDAEALPALPRAVESCRALHERRQLEGTIIGTDKAFFAHVASGQELLGLAALRELLLCRALVGGITRYLGELPVLGTVDLLLTPPNATIERSQRFHFDFAGPQIKLILNVLDTSEEHGPFTLLSADVSERIAQAEHYSRGRLSDETVRKHVAPSEWHRLCGPPGSGALVDTSRCLHFGSRQNRLPRLVLIVQYISLFAPGLAPADWRGRAQQLAEGLAAPARMLFRLR